MSAIAIDTLIRPRWIAPVVPKNTLLAECAIAIKDGKIIGVHTQKSAQHLYQPAEIIDLPDHIVIPGLINAHGHAAMSLLRGFANDRPLHIWLEEHIWPAEAKHVSYDFVEQGTELAIAEMILSGTTCYSDMYFYPEAAAAATQKAGIRAQLCFPILDFPTPWAATTDEYFAKGLKLHDEHRNHPRIHIGFGPHAPYTVGDTALTRTATLASELDAAIQIHTHETAHEVETALRESGTRPLQRLADLGILGPKTQCVHMTQASAADIELLATWKSHVVHCPESNLKLASGICPVVQIQQAGINIALGTDSAASNNDLNLLGEMKTAALLGKMAANNAAALDAHTMLAMATLNGAKALGIEDKAGSIEVGKQADLTAISLSCLLSVPNYDPVAQLVYTDCSNRVTHVWVDGRLLLKDRILQTLDPQRIMSNVQQWQQKIAR